MLQTDTTTYLSDTQLSLLDAPLSRHLPTDEHVAVRRERLSELAIDDALAGSFPASDPPAWNPGMARPIPAGASRDRANDSRLVPFAILVVGLPIALAVRGLLEVFVWLFPTDRLMRRLQDSVRAVGP